MANEVTVHIKTKDDEARAGMRAFEEEAKASGERSGKGFSDRFKSAMGSIGKGGGLFAGLSGGLAAASPLAGLGLAVGAFSAVAVPELTKVRDAMSQTGKAGQKAMANLTGPEKQLVPALRSISSAFSQVKAALAPVVDHTIALGAKLVSDLMPALKIMASAGGKVIDSFLKPFDALIRSNTFDQFIKVMAQGAQQIGSVLGPSVVNLIKSLMQLFVQVMPSGVQILQVLLPLFAQIVTDITPFITYVAQLVAQLLQWLSVNHLLIPALAAVGVALMLAMDTNPIGLLLTAVALLVAAIVELAKRWGVSMADVKRVVGEVVTWIKENWKTLAIILMGPIGLAIVFIVDHFHRIVSVASTVVGLVSKVWSPIYDAIVGPVIRAVSFASGLITQLLNLIGLAKNNAKQVMGNSVTNVGAFNAGGPRFGLAHGGIFGAATGGIRGNLTMVGEHGRELVSLPTGSKVHSNPDTERMMAQGGGGNSYSITVNVPPTANMAEVGRKVVESIKEFERGSGKSWRS